MWKSEGLIVRKTWRCPLEVVYQDAMMTMTYPFHDPIAAARELYLAILRRSATPKE